jgi:hypothetical protein
VPGASRNYPFDMLLAGMNLLAIALLVLATSASLGQPAQEGRRNPPDRSREQGVEVPRAWGPAIVPELRSRATRDVPMGGGKPKDSRGDQDSDDRHTRPF